MYSPGEIDLFPSNNQSIPLLISSWKVFFQLQITYFVLCSLQIAIICLNGHPKTVQPEKIRQYYALTMFSFLNAGILLITTKAYRNGQVFLCIKEDRVSWLQ